MPLVEKGRPQRGAEGPANEPPRYQVKIIGGRRVVVWQNGDNGLQQPFRPPPSRTADPLRSQVRVDQNPTVIVTPSGGSSQSQYRPVPPVQSPQQVPAARLVSGSAGSGHGATPGPTEQNGQPAGQGAGQSIVSSREAAVTYSQSAPRRKSDVTGGGLGSSFSVLPPIAAGRSDTQRKKLGELDEITLKNEIYRSADAIHERRIQRILNEMRTLDRDRDGVLEPAQVKRILHKHQLKFSPEANDNLVIKFSETPKTVRYEKLVQYLGSIKLEASRTVAPPDSETAKAPPPGRLGRRFNDRDEARLREDLAAYLRPRPLDLELTSRTFYDMDRDRNGFLSAEQVEAGLHRAGLTDMPQELLQRLCTATDRHSNGLCDIDKINVYLGRASPGVSGATGTIPGIGNNHHPRLPRQPPPVNANAAYRPHKTTYEAQLPTQVADDPPSVATPDPADVVPYDTAYPPSPPAVAFDEDSWLADYQKLVQTLYQTNDDGSGYMTPSEVGRITESYNMIYSLGIPLELVTQALSQATEPNYGMIQLSVYTDVLMNLFLSSL